MAIQEATGLLHWNYFLALESDMERLARFVEFTTHNFGTYSIEMAHLFLAAASEVDVVAKLLCSRMDASANAANIEQYRQVLHSSLPKIKDSVVTIPRYGLDLQPWSDWRENETPDWWRSHNKVKHQRDEHFALANLKNLLNAMAGLFLLVLYYYREIVEHKKLEPPPNLFTPPADLASVYLVMGGRIALCFEEAR